MSAMARLVMGKFYRAAAGQPERLPWHRSLTLKRSEVTDFEAPLPFGPVVCGVGYRFQRASA